MARVSLYRKYRSQSFSDLVGQNHVVKTLQNGIASGRIAHAFLFTGPRGTGKTSTARLMAKALCCREGPSAEPCNVCDICISITEGNCMDVQEMDAASESGVDDVRESIVDAVNYKPSTARYRVFIIDEVHDLSAKAFDALLKTIEEPPDHVIFILATTEYTKVPTTVRSRCQKFEFHRASIADLVERINYVSAEEGVPIEPAAAAAIARMADGGFRDALTLLEQAIIAGEEKITVDQVYDQLGLIADQSADTLLQALKEGNVPSLLETVGELSRLGRDPRAIVESLLFRTAELTRAAYNVDLQGVDAAQAATLHETAQRIGIDTLLWLRGMLAETHLELRNVTLPRLWFEAQMVRLAQLRNAPVVTAPVRQAVVETHKSEVRSPRAEPDSQKAEIKSQKAEKEIPKPAEVEEIKRPERVSTGDATLDRAIGIWQEALGLLPTETPIARKLTGSRAVRVIQTTITVEVPRKMDAVWISEDPKRIGFLVKMLAEKKQITGWAFEFVGPVEKKVDQEPTAVELELSGKALHDAVKEVFQS